MENREKTNPEAKNYELIGKKSIVEYPQLTLYMNYLSDHSLHWKAVYGDGTVQEDEEKMVYQKLTDHLFFLNWIEKDGRTISQIVNPKNGTVKTFSTYFDENSDRGQRSAIVGDATFRYDEA
jgi:hypothetical protein